MIGWAGSSWWTAFMRRSTRSAGGTVQYYNNVGYSLLLRGNLNGAVTNFAEGREARSDNLVVANNMHAGD